MNDITDENLNILIIDDSPNDCLFYRRILTRATSFSCNVVEASTGQVGIDETNAQTFDCILLDFNLPDMDGLEVLASFNDRLKTNRPPVILLTGVGNERVAVEAMKAGAREYLVKGQLTPLDLENAVLKAIENAKLQRELDGAYQQLEVKNEQQRQMTDTALQFVDDVAHEFRTPLAVIHEFTALMNDGIGGAVTDQHKEFLNFTASATRDLAQMVDDFLDSSRLKHRALRVDRKPHHIVELFDHVRQTIQTRAQSKQIRIEESIDDDLPELIFDLDKAGRTLVNFVVNAIKFSPNQSVVTLSAALHDGDVLVSVTDQGPGMSQEQVVAIGQRFNQGPSATMSKAKGFGLGLNIAAQLVRLNLGEMVVTSQPDNGSTFSFSLPRHDSNRIMERYFSLMTTTDINRPFSIVKATPLKPGEPIGPLRQFLSSICHPMDLILTDTVGNGLLLVGETAEPQNWIQRIQLRHDDAAGSSQRPNPFAVSWLGTWPKSEPASSLIASVQSYLEEKRACA